mmetsp:Transcript_490/g.1454  ORF Transcript_490/g.1454 Transcript_490/m.1454 type:complete len:493 (+) Transcript_490:615-2093(+)
MRDVRDISLFYSCKVFLALSRAHSHREHGLDVLVGEDVLGVQVPPGRVELLHGVPPRQPLLHGLDPLGGGGHLDLGPVVHGGVAVQHGRPPLRLVRVEVPGYGGPLRGVLGGEVHDDAHPRVHHRLVVGGGGGHGGGARGRPPLLDGRGRGDALPRDHPHSLLHQVQVRQGRLGQRPSREGHLGHPLLPPAVEAEDVVARVEPVPLGPLPELRLRLVDAHHQRAVAGVGGYEGVTHLRVGHGLELLPRHARLHLLDEVAEGGEPLVARILGGAGEPRAGLGGVARHHHDGVSVRDPHVAKVLVLGECLGVVLSQLLGGGHVGVLQQVVQGHALQGDLGDDPERAEPAPREAEERGVGLPAQLERPQGGGDEAHAHHLLLHGRDEGARAVAPSLSEAAHLLLADGGVVLQGEAVRLDCLHEVPHVSPRLHRHLPLGLVHLHHLMHQPHVEHALVAQPAPVGGDAVPKDAHGRTALVVVQDNLGYLRPGGCFPW